MLAGDLSSAQIQGNLAYYRELRGMLLQGKPVVLDRPKPTALGECREAPGRSLPRMEPPSA